MTTAIKRAMQERVARRLRGLLAEERISATELARKLGWTQSYMARRYDGRTALDVDDLEAIATELGVRMVDLLPGEGAQDYPRNRVPTARTAATRPPGRPRVGAGTAPSPERPRFLRRPLIPA